MAYRIKLDRSKCVGCYACYVACLDAHYQAEDEHAISFRSIQKYTDKEHEFEKNICVGCIHCGKCMQVCPQHAIYQDEETQFILVNQELCTGCKLCEKNCEAGAITVTNFLAHIDASKCTNCGVCAEKCPRKIITPREIPVS